MPTEDFVARFTADIKDARAGFNAIVDSAVQMGQRFPEAAKGFERVEKAAARAGGQFSQAATEVNKNTAAVKGNADAIDKSTVSMNSQRYALYDVASTYTAISVALLAASAAAIKVGADFESAFSSVQRTTMDASGNLAPGIEGIRQSLVDLSTQIPVTFDDLTKIATLGAQLGLDSAQLDKFSETVAKFASATGITVEASATAFGRLNELLPDVGGNFDALGSSILLTGVNSVATEAQIISTAQQIAGIGTAAGLSATEVIAFSSALASVGVAPELARGVATRLFSDIASSVANGGKQLDAFAKVSGQTAAEFSAAWSADPAQAIVRLLKGINDSGGNAYATLDAIGITADRDQPAVLKLAQNFQILEKALVDTDNGFSDSTFLDASYATVLEDLNSQFQLLVNSVNALIAEASGGAVGGLAGFVGTLTDMVNAAREFANNPVAKTITGIGLAIATVTGVFFAYRAAQALATATTYALFTAQTALNTSLGATGITGLLRVLLPVQLANSAAMVTSARAGATFAVSNAGVATSLSTVSASAGVARAAITSLSATILPLVAILTALQFAFAAKDTGQFFSDATNGAFGLQDALNGLNGRSADYLGTQAKVSDGMVVLGENSYSAGDALFGLISPLFFVANAMAGTYNTAVDLSGAIGSLQGAIGAAIASTTQGTATAKANTAATNTQAKATQGLGRAAGGAAKQVRTLVDYGNDLGKVFDRAFDIRFGSQAALDKVTTSWMDLNEQMADYRRRVQELTADRAVQAYFLSVAEAYNDTLRAGLIRSNISDIDAELADATANASTELKGNSKAAIINRKRITDLVAGYQDYIQSLASSGKSQAQINAAVAKSRAEFLAQAQALGYSNAQLKPYIASFNDMAVAVARVPRNITVTANTNPAIQALNELQAAAKSLGGQTFPGPKITNPNNAKEIRRMALETAIAVQSAWAQQLKNSGNISGAVKALDSLATMRNNLKSGNYWTGGYTGNGGKYEPKGVVHGGEFVFNKQATQNAGVGNLYAMQRAMQSGRGYATGGYVPSASAPSVGGLGGIIELGPKTLRTIRESGGNFSLNLDPRGVATLSNEGNKMMNGMSR